MSREIDFQEPSTSLSYSTQPNRRFQISFGPYSSTSNETNQQRNIFQTSFRNHSQKYMFQKHVDKFEKLHKKKMKNTSEKVDKSSQMTYFPVKMANRRVNKEVQCNMRHQILHKPLCNSSHLCVQSKWMVRRLVDYNIQTKVRAPQQAAAFSLGISEKTATACMKAHISNAHMDCKDQEDRFSHAPSCRIVRKRMTRRQMWERSVKHIDGMIADKIKRLIHEEFYKKCRTVSVSRLLAKLQEEMQEDGGFQCSESNFRLIMRGLGYRFRKLNFRPVVFERQDLIDWRKRYLRQIDDYRRKGYRIVYLDETWVFAGMTQRYDWVDIEALENPYRSKNKGYTTGPRTPASRGKRAIVVHCLSADGLINGAELIFASNSTDDDGDYHREMDAETFENYIKRIAPLLKGDSDIPVVLVMDNAPCHSRYNDKVPTMATKGNEMRDWLRRHNILFPELATKKSLYESLIAPLNKEEFNSYAVEKIAQDNGILILRLPPYHCDLNPIEFVWGWCKRQLRDELNRDDKLKAVMARTKEVFQKLPDKVVRGFFSHVQKTEKRYARLDGVLLHDPARPLVIHAEDFQEDSDSEDEIDVDVIEQSENEP